MHADCRAQSRCEKCTAPFASSAALAKHKRFCDVANSVNNNNNQKVTTRLQGQTTLPPAPFQFQVNPNFNNNNTQKAEGREASALFAQETHRLGESLEGPRILPSSTNHRRHSTMEALRLEILNNQNKVLSQHHHRLHRRRRTRSQIQEPGFTPPPAQLIQINPLQHCPLKRKSHQKKNCDTVHLRISHSSSPVRSPCTIHLQQGSALNSSVVLNR